MNIDYIYESKDLQQCPGTVIYTIAVSCELLV